MSLADRFLSSYTHITEDEANRLSLSPADQHVVEVNPPQTEDVPATLNRFIRNIMEIQSRWWIRNYSPISTLEIRRSDPDRLRIQFTSPTRRLERKIRAYLTEEIPSIRLEAGVSGLPVTEGATVGGGLLALGRPDYFPLKTDFQRPVSNSLIATLHRHSNPQTKAIVQVVFQPLIGHPIKHRWWVRKAYKRIRYLRRDKPGLLPWHNRTATKRERKQADLIETKASQPLWKTAVRLLVINGGEHTKSRLKELSAGLDSLESPITNQFFNLHTIQSLFHRRFIDFAEAVRKREFNGWAYPFRTSPEELAALVSIPDKHQSNLKVAHR